MWHHRESYALARLLSLGHRRQWTQCQWRKPEEGECKKE